MCKCPMMEEPDEQEVREAVRVRVGVETMRGSLLECEAGETGRR